MDFDWIAIFFLGIIVLTFGGGMIYLTTKFHCSTDRMLKRKAEEKRQRESMLDAWAQDL